ncbi:putative Bromodomain testis-specific protein [Xylariomycetidae sp. FL2044]|nr:putative Bromodomain testis-specific protein [Xylariomycetidae sp. FL2044]
MADQNQNEKLDESREAPVNGEAHGIQETCGRGEVHKKSFSWFDPHTKFVVIMAGEDEIPFSIQEDLLCHKSSVFRTQLGEMKNGEGIEKLLHLREYTSSVFGLAQHFLYTGSVMPLEDHDTDIASYQDLISLWMLGNKYDINGLCDTVTSTMEFCKLSVKAIPNRDTLVAGILDAPEKSPMKLLLLKWASEYIETSESRGEFIRSLPKEILDEILMFTYESKEPAPPTQSLLPPVNRHKNVHYLDDEGEEDATRTMSVNVAREQSLKRPANTNHTPRKERKSLEKRPPSKALTKTVKPAKARRSTIKTARGEDLSPEQKLRFCEDLMTKMLSGPGFWTRLVGPFKDPVIPKEDNVPDYLDIIKKPMDLNTIKAKLDRHEYATADDFANDVRQIFSNCFTYWDGTTRKNEHIVQTCRNFQKTFEAKYAEKSKWAIKAEEGEDSLMP